MPDRDCWPRMGDRHDLYTVGATAILRRFGQLMCSFFRETLKLHSQASNSGFDIALLSDLLHFHNSHAAILTSLTSLLARTSSARAYIASGTYTPPHVCANFLRLATAAGLELTEGAPEDEWNGSLEVWRIGKLSPNDLGVRKAMCRWWVAKWNDAALSLPNASS